MEVQLTPEQEAELSEIAAHNGITPEQLVKNAALNLLLDEARYRSALRRSIAAADRGELIDHEDVKARIANLLQSR